MVRPTLDDGADFVNALLYGDYGTRKTTALAHLAKLGRLVYVDAEGGLKRRPLKNLGVPVENIEPRSVSEYTDLDNLFWEIKERLELSEDDPDRPAGVAFDSETEIQARLLENIVEGRVERLAAAHQESDPFDTDRGEYKVVTEMLRRSVRKFRDLPCHVAFSTLEKRELDGDSVAYRPKLTPAFASDLGGYVDVVGHTVILENGQGVAVFKNSGVHRGKDRFNMLPPVMADPTLDRIVAVINEELSLAGDEAQQKYLDFVKRD